MRVSEVFYERKISDHNYGNQTVGVTISVGIDDDYEVALEAAELVVNNKLGTVIAATDDKIEKAASVVRELEERRSTLSLLKMNQSNSGDDEDIEF